MQAMRNWSQYKPADFLYSGAWIRNWFSNFAPCKLYIGGIVYNSVENYYQAQKSINIKDWPRIAVLSPRQAKQAGKRLTLRPDWMECKRAVMKIGLQHKFAYPSMWYDRLMATGDDMIIEWNNWGDKYWGVSSQDSRGHNHLGLLLMEIRETFKTK